ncbi:hypothetical protein VP02_00590 [Pseudomonas ogarae]|uniref:Uncharacterized protein n=1 Tax=Pseudomonas kilonensis TaxID=132476 RepID=A0A0F4XWZ9_9PSED|nr:hypothetical protein VP02_00590 [Pseudomonas ogarae]
MKRSPRRNVKGARIYVPTVEEYIFVRSHIYNNYRIKWNVTNLLDTLAVHRLPSHLHFSGNGMTRDGTVKMSFFLKLMITIIIPLI